MLQAVLPSFGLFPAQCCLTLCFQCCNKLLLPLLLLLLLLLLAAT
jgi:hypothetical protein